MYDINDDIFVIAVENALKKLNNTITHKTSMNTKLHIVT